MSIITVGTLADLASKTVRLTGGAIVVAGLFILPFLLNPGTGSGTFSSIHLLLIEILVVNCIILAGVAFIVLPKNVSEERTDQRG